MLYFNKDFLLCIIVSLLSCSTTERHVYASTQVVPQISLFYSKPSLNKPVLKGKQDIPLTQQQRSIRRPISRPHVLKPLNAYGESAHLSSDSNTSPAKLEIKLDNHVQKQVHFQDVPQFDESTYTGQKQIANTGYFYAIDAKRPSPKVITRQHAKKGNDIKATGLSGSLKFKEPNYSDDQIIILQALINHGHDGHAACEVLKVLLAVDGAEFTYHISNEEMRDPKHHYFAVLVEDRGEGLLYSREHVFHPRYWRLNQGGVWSSKNRYNTVQKADVPFFDNINQAKEYFVGNSFEVPYKPKFCGFFKVTSSMKTFLEMKKY